MPDTKEIQHYHVYLKMYGSMMVDLSTSEDFIDKLINNDNLTEFEQALRKKIRKAPRC